MTHNANEQTLKSDTSTIRPELANEPIRFNHIHFKSGRITVASRRSADFKQNVIGMAYCSPTDRFDKTLGRKIAEQRLNAMPLVIPFVKNTRTDVENLIEDISKEIYPPYTVGFAPRWIRLKDEKPSVRKLALGILDDDIGISEDAWNELAGLLIAEGNNEDIINAVSCTEGWVYIENHVVRECFPEHFQKSIDETVIA